jgi:hypothetical protein
LKVGANMDTVKSISKTAGSDAASTLFQSATRETLGGSVSTQSTPDVKRVFELRTNIGKRFVIESPLIRITPDKLGFVQVGGFERGVWSPIMTTPYYFDLTTKEAE